MTDLTLPAGSTPARAETPVVAVALAALLVGAGWLGVVYGWRQGALYLGLTVERTRNSEA
jgi:hypothetical protein